jgi:hypothetical protein
MPHRPRLATTITFCALAPVAATTGGEQPSAVPEYGAAPRLVERDPELHLGAERLETDPGIVLKVLDKLILIQHALIPFVQIVRKIPVEECDHRLDACLAKVIDKFDIVLEAFLVDGVIPSTKWDDAGPRQREAVRFCAQFLQKVNVLGSSVVGVTGHLSRVSTSDLAWNAAETVPDGVCATVFVRRALDLITVVSKSVRNREMTRRVPWRGTWVEEVGQRTWLLRIPIESPWVDLTETCWA